MRTIILILCVMASSAYGQKPVEVVQAQLDAYNEQDLEAFTKVFAENAKLFMNLGDTIPAIVGRQEISKRYGDLFRANPDNKSTLIGRMTQGNFVFDHEWITGREQPVKIMAIYEVENGKIVRCWFIR